MKLITLNTHSIVEPDYEEKLYSFSRVVLEERPEILALQEVNQTVSAEPAPEIWLEETGYLPCGRREGMEPATVRMDNHAFRLAWLLKEGGYSMAWTWIPAKVGYGRYDEGLALFTVWPVGKTDQFFISESHDYQNWKTRRVLGMNILTPSGLRWFGCVHMGWWQDEEEPFREQWARLCAELEKNWMKAEPGQEQEAVKSPIWLMGDCNSRADIRGEGYDLIRSSGWYDMYEMARLKDQGDTASGPIDGWKEEGSAPGMRIDHIWCSERVPAAVSRVICNGINGPLVSDHYGLVTEI